MTGRRSAVRLSCLTSMLCLSLGGCAIVADALNPLVLTNLGLAESALVPDYGVVLMVFNNTTQSDAVFYGFSAGNADNLALNSRNFSTYVPAGENRNEAIECPVEVVGAGQIAGDGLSDVVAVVNGNDVNYANGALAKGTGFQCGDVIEVRLLQVGTGDQAAFTVIVQVLPGQ